MSALALLAWLYLALFHGGFWGGFWRDGPELAPARPASLPAVDIIVPARNEAESIAPVIASLLAQDYPGPFRILLVDDASTDATMARAPADPGLVAIPARPRPRGWSGKVWAMAEGLARAEAPLLLFTDADILHDPRHLSTLVAKAEAEGLDLVSEMVALRCVSLAERALVPAFVHFFRLLYPFAWVNDPLSATAAAAGGTMLVRARALARIGGMAAIAPALIDDVALARAIKRGGRVWLGLSGLARSLRPYPHLGDLWRVIARTAFVQLRRSWALLILAEAGLGGLFLVPPLEAFLGCGLARLSGLAAWGLMGATYLPMLRRYARSPLWAPALPLVALFYMAATLGSALDHARGRGAAWKSRAYGAAP